MFRLLVSDDAPIPPGFSDIDDVIAEFEKDPALAADLARGRHALQSLLPAGSVGALAALRLSRGLSQRQFAEMIGMQKPQVAQLESLESDVEYMKRDIGEIKSDIREIKRDQRAGFRILFGAIIAAALGLAGLMATGFGWIK